MANARHLDLAIPAGLAVLAGVAFVALPAGSIVRVALALAVLLFVPGHLLVQALARMATSRRQRMVRAVVALGITPPLVGLLALATAALPGGFRAGSIVLVVVVACVALAGVAAWRRRAALATVRTAQPSVA